jgi:hypothetical protein
MVNPVATAHELTHHISVLNPVAIFCDPEDVMSKVNAALDMSKSSDMTKPAIIGLGEAGTATLTVSASNYEK